MSPQRLTSLICGVCGTPAEVPLPPVGLEPTEPSDFDTRPGEPLRSSIVTWVQMCPHCGYCAEDVGSAAPGAAEIVASDEYRAALADPEMPPPARAFVGYSLLLERLHMHADAGWSALHAAWVCDDFGAEGAAMDCRQRALALWRNGKASGLQFADDLGSEFALATDLYRRIGQFEQASVACAEGLDLEDVPPVIEQLLRRQTVLIQGRDTEAHSMSELTAASPQYRPT